MKYGVIITAGGTSSRFGNTNKLIEKIYDKEVIEYTVEAFITAKIESIVICAHKTLLEHFEELFKKYENVIVIEGGATRQESVYKGLQKVNCDYVLIHDGARPLISQEIIDDVKKSVVEKKAISVMTKTTDTIKEVDETGKIIKTLDRSKLYNTQTPQAFEYSLIKSVHEKLIGGNYTDDAGMVEIIGNDVYIVNGDPKNIKITTRSDIEFVKEFLK